MNQNYRRIEAISARTLDNYVGKESYIIIDLRENEEYERGHVSGAVNIPYSEFENKKVNIEKVIGNIDRGRKAKNDTLIFYCERGGVSMRVAKELSRLGYETKTVVGGYNAITAYKSRGW